MASSGYSAWSVVAGETPTTAKWNTLGSNDASFNTGNGFNDGAIVSRHLGANLSVSNVERQPYKFSVYRSAALTPAASTIIWDTVLFDTGSNYSTSTGRFTAPVAGFYFLMSYIDWQGTSANRGTGICLYKNGTTQIASSNHVCMYSGGYSDYINTMGVFQLAANDYITVFDTSNSGFAMATGQSGNTFMGFLMSST